MCRVRCFSDVTAGSFVGTFLVLGTEGVLKQQHRRDSCVRGWLCAPHAKEVSRPNNV